MEAMLVKYINDVKVIYREDDDGLEMFNAATIEEARRLNDSIYE